MAEALVRYVYHSAGRDHRSPEFVYPPRGKPYLKNDGAFHFSISHTDSYAFVGYSRGRGHRSDKNWTVVRLENEFIRLAILPALGGRIFEACDKVTRYDFLYRQHVIKPALIGAYGSWISGGIKFNWPFHHRPSTVMPVDYEIQREADGSVIVWLSEHAPNDRTKGMVGIVLRPDASYFETRVAVTNRTPHKHNFLWWENAAVAVHEDYRLVFPPDVT